MKRMNFAPQRIYIFCMDIDKMELYTIAIRYWIKILILYINSVIQLADLQ